MTFLLAKEKTMHVCLGDGKWLAVDLRERDGAVWEFETAEAMAVGARRVAQLPSVAEALKTEARSGLSPRIALSVEFGRRG